MKKRDHNLNEPVDKQQFKKKYILRKLEEVDAEQEIKQYDHQVDELPKDEE